MTKSVEIPQDIIDNVIAAVGDDTHLLKQCSLVSSSVLRPSRKQLFSRISINDNTCQGIHQLLVQNPDIQSFVRDITLTESMPNWRIVLEWANCSSLLAILRLPFCCLERFSIIVHRDEWDGKTSESDWNSNPISELEDVLSNMKQLSTIKTLSLERITEVPITFFLRIDDLTTLVLLSLPPNDLVTSTQACWQLGREWYQRLFTQ